MIWQPEMELIDQLEGGPMPLSTVRPVFKDDRRARLVLAIYIDRGVLVLIREGSPLQAWEAKQLLQDDKTVLGRDDLFLDLTEAGAKAFQIGGWSELS
jgi:hypothetical protein